MEKYGNWEIIEKLGEGGQGTVYLVRDIRQGGSTEDQIRRIRMAVATLSSASTEEAQRDQAYSLAHGISQLSRSGLKSTAYGALKLLHEPRESQGLEKAKKRMRAEVEALTTVNHPNVIKILEHNLEKNWFVSEYFPRGPLSNHSSLFKGNTLAALTVFRQLVEGVAKLHSNKLIHRDIKPANVFVAEDGKLVLGDLGLVFFMDENRTRVSENYENVGSRDWIPPWAYGKGARLEDIGPTFDLFCLGKLLWTMLSGRTMLSLWYHRKEEYSLEKMFPEDDSIIWAGKILDVCVVEEETDCLTNAEDLLAFVDRGLSAVRNHSQVIAEGVVRKCTVCGIGFYKYFVNEQDNPGKFGLRPDIAPTPSFKVFFCNHCGHTQIFCLPKADRPPVWDK
jgi:serine/threonine protein kinase